MVSPPGTAGLRSSHWSCPSKRSVFKVRKGQVALGGRAVSVKSLVLAPHTPGLETQPCLSQACDLGCDICPLWASVSPSGKCRAGTDELRGPPSLALPPSTPRVETQPHSAPACTRSPASPHAALLFKVAVVWLTLFLKPIPVLELSSTRPAVTTKNVCRVTATSEEVGGGRRPRMGPQSGWIKKKKKRQKPAL